MRAVHQVPQEDASKAGTRVKFQAKFRGQMMVFEGTLLWTRWERSLASETWRVQPDYIEEYRALTAYALSLNKLDIVEVMGC